MCCNIRTRHMPAACTVVRLAALCFGSRCSHHSNASILHLQILKRSSLDGLAEPLPRRRRAIDYGSVGAGRAWGLACSHHCTVLAVLRGKLQQHASLPRASCSAGVAWSSCLLHFPCSCSTCLPRSGPTSCRQLELLLCLQDSPLLQRHHPLPAACMFPERYHH